MIAISNPMAPKPTGTYANWKPERPGKMHEVNLDVSQEMNATSRPKTTHTCVDCRRRKIKCDGCFPCKQCVSSGHECKLQPPRLVSSGRLPNRSSQKSCDTCRRRRMKCDGHQPCGGCIQLRVVCNRPEQNDSPDEPPRGRSHSPQRASSAGRGEGTSSPVRDMINERLEMANEARANESNSPVKEEPSSPFRSGSPYANDYSAGRAQYIDLTHDSPSGIERPQEQMFLQSFSDYLPTSSLMATRSSMGNIDTKGREAVAASVAKYCLENYENIEKSPPETNPHITHLSEIEMGFAPFNKLWLSCACINVASGRQCGHFLQGWASLISHITKHLEKDSRFNTLANLRSRDEFRRCLCGQVFGSAQEFLPHLRECLPKLIVTMLPVNHAKPATAGSGIAKAASSVHEQTQVDDRSTMGVAPGPEQHEASSSLPGPPKSSKSLCPYCWKDYNFEFEAYVEHVTNCRHQVQPTVKSTHDKTPVSTKPTKSTDVASTAASTSDTSMPAKEDAANILAELSDVFRALRTHKACDECRMSKTKCHGNNPCTRCIKNNKSCVFALPRRRNPKGKEYVTQLEERLQRMEQLLRSTGVLDQEEESAVLVNSEDVSEPGASKTTHDAVAADLEAPRAISVSSTERPQHPTPARQASPPRVGDRASSDTGPDMLEILFGPFDPSNNFSRPLYPKRTENEQYASDPNLPPWHSQPGMLAKFDVDSRTRQPYTINQSPSFHHSSYLPKLEGSLLKNFVCCNITLGTMHDLLEHYERVHGANSTGTPSDGKRTEVPQLDRTVTDAYLRNAASHSSANGQHTTDDLAAERSNRSMPDQLSKASQGVERPSQPPLAFKEPWAELMKAHENTNKELSELALSIFGSTPATKQFSASHSPSYHSPSDANGIGGYWICCNVRFNTLPEVLQHYNNDADSSVTERHQASSFEARMKKDIVQLTKDTNLLRKDIKIPIFGGMKICLAKADFGVDAAPLKATLIDILKKEGAEYHEDMTKQVTHLIATTPTHTECDDARRWGTCLVSFQWLLECIKQDMTLSEWLYPPVLHPVDHRQQQEALQQLLLVKTFNGGQKGPAVEQNPAVPDLSFANPRAASSSAPSNIIPNVGSEAETDAKIQDLLARMRAQSVTERASSTPSTTSKKRARSPDKDLPSNKSISRKHACKICGAAFQRPGTRDIHERTHSDEKTFQCTVEGCDEAFKQDNERVRHEKFQHGEKRFVCGGKLPSGVSWGCGKQFRRRDGLKEHHTKTEKGKACYKARVEVPLMTSSTPVYIT